MLTDVLVCGGGPGGLAAAIACRMRGFDVTVVECAVPPVDKACGEGLFPDALAALDELGVDLNKIPGGRFHGIRFMEHDRAAEARFRSGTARGMRRTHLHTALHARSHDLGVGHLWQTTVLGLSMNESHIVAETTRGPIKARWCIGADGLNSRVRLWAALEGDSRCTKRIGLRTHLQVAPWSDCVEVYWGERGQAYVTPTAPNEISLAVVTSGRYKSIHSALEEFPTLAERIAGADRTSSERGAATVNRALKRVTNRRVALLGDASGSVDALTGAGLGLAFRQALALANALGSGDLQSYEAANRAILRRTQWIARGLLLLDAHPALRRATFGAFRLSPQLFQSLLEFHAGESGTAKTHEPIALSQADV